MNSKSHREEVSTELTLSCRSHNESVVFSDSDVVSATTKIMPKYCHRESDQAQPEVSTELTLASGSQKESMDSWGSEREVLTELALFGRSCEFQRANYKRKTSQTCATMKMMQYCHRGSDQAQPEVSTELTLACGSQREVPAELTLSGGSCEFQKSDSYTRQLSETCASDVASASMEKMLKYCHRDSDQAHQEVSTELTLACDSQKESMDSWRPEGVTLSGVSCGFQKRDNYKGKISETCDSSAQNEVSSESTLSCGFQMEASKESMVSWEPENEVSTDELIPSCGFQPRVNKLKISEKINDPYLFAPNLFDKSSGSSKQNKSIEKTAIGSKGESSVTMASKTETNRVHPNRDYKQKEERRQCVSEDSWGLKKTLRDIDLSNRDRLVLPTRMVNEHILPFLKSDKFKQVESTHGMAVTVWDQDSQLEYQFVFKMWYSYALHGDWHENFWMRRGLKKGDVIGLSWDSQQSRFIFCVLKRSPTPRS